MCNIRQRVFSSPLAVFSVPPELIYERKVEAIAFAVCFLPPFFAFFAPQVFLNKRNVHSNKSLLHIAKCKITEAVELSIKTLSGLANGLNVWQF